MKRARCPLCQQPMILTQGPAGAIVVLRLRVPPVQDPRRPAEPGAVVVSPLLDAKQAATLLNVPASWVAAEARAGRIPHVRLGRYVRFDADELQAWWRTRRQGPWRTTGAAAAAARKDDVTA